MMKRRGRGEGSIFRRKDGLWCAAVTAGYDANGKRRRRSVYGTTKGAVLEQLTRLQHETLTGTLSDPQRFTVAAFLGKWVEDARPAIRATTHALYDGLIRLHIVPTIGGVALSKLSPAHLQGLLATMEKASASPKLRVLVYGVLHRALGQALQWGMVPRNVCEAVQRPRAPRPTMRTLNATQVSQLLEAVRVDRLEALYVLAVTTGLRQGELLGLQWENVDLDNGAVQIRHQLQEVAGKLALVEPKTSRSRRRVDLPALAVVALMEHRKRMRAQRFSIGEGYVFTDTEGGPIRKSNLRRRSFAPLLTLEGLRTKLRKEGVPEDALPKPLPRIRFHDLRHTAATLHLQGGTHPKVVQEMLGHSTISMTLDTYSHTVPSMQKEAAANMDRLLSGG